MERKKGRVLSLLLSLLCAAQLGACMQPPKSKTIILPEEEKRQLSDGDDGNDYTVKKIYTQEYMTVDNAVQTAFIRGCGENEIRFAVREDNTESISFNSVDYRYGFYEVYGTSTYWEWDLQRELHLMGPVISPAGTNMIWMDMENSYVGGRLYLRNLQTGEDTLLLDGDEEGYSLEYYMPLAAWSPDGSLLCYGFYPRNSAVWNKDGVDMRRLWYWDLEKGCEAGGFNFSAGGLTGKTDKLEETQLWIDRSGSRAMAVLGSKRSYKDGIWLEIFSGELSGEAKEGQGAEEPEFTEPATAIMDLDSICRPNMENERLYANMIYQGISEYDSSGRFLTELPSANHVKDFLVLDGGNTFITVESVYGMSYQEDICLYTRDEEENMLEQTILYKDAGYVFQIQYDPVYRRLLAETGDLNGDEAMENTMRRVLVLEF